MASFTTQPSTSVLHGVLSELEGGTLNYVFAHTVTGNEFAPALTVEYWINGSKYAETDINGYETRVHDGSDYDYTFNIDASVVAQRFFDVQSVMFPTTTTNANWQAELQLRVYVWSPDSDGILTKGGSSTNSNTVDVINALVSNLSSYSTLASTRRFLTYEPEQSFLLLGQEKYLWLWSDANTTDLRVRTYTTAGTLLKTLIAAYDDVGLVAVSLNDSDLESETNVLADVIDISAASYILVDFGTYDNVTDVWTQGTETRRYYVIDSAYRSLELHFQNELGVHDTLILKDAEWSTRLKTEYEYYQKRDEGTRALQGIEQSITEIELQGLDNEDFDWLKSINKSSIFYLDTVMHYLEGTEYTTNQINQNNDIAITLTRSIANTTHRG